MAFTWQPPKMRPVREDTANRLSLRHRLSGLMADREDTLARRGYRDAGQGAGLRANWRAFAASAPRPEGHYNQAVTDYTAGRDRAQAEMLRQDRVADAAHTREVAYLNSLLAADARTQGEAGPSYYDAQMIQYEKNALLGGGSGGAYRSPVGGGSAPVGRGMGHPGGTDAEWSAKVRLRNRMNAYLSPSQLPPQNPYVVEPVGGAGPSGGSGPYIRPDFSGRTANQPFTADIERTRQTNPPLADALRLAGGQLFFEDLGRYAGPWDYDQNYILPDGRSIQDLPRRATLSNERRLPAAAGGGTYIDPSDPRLVAMRQRYAELGFVPFEVDPTAYRNRPGAGFVDRSDRLQQSGLTPDDQNAWLSTRRQPGESSVDYSIRLARLETGVATTDVRSGEDPRAYSTRRDKERRLKLLEKITPGGLTEQQRDHVMLSGADYRRKWNNRAA